ncbi:sulfurtransferase TusA family protein [uncultured Cohaesibacter sp.]|uniref:sulfurtransferase TusA family protein n=1 Tax=uncultured Cohaesibacter sp. TaxID=1002546 RepID=UPI002931659A|nr:sulfurtransferase TusA family protein [uncultured Cohaesibacter sp.]
MTELDLSDLKCPMPTLLTQKALERLMPGDRLHVTTTDPMARIDLPHFCSQKQHTLVEMHQLDDTRMIFIIQKGEADPSREA